MKPCLHQRKPLAWLALGALEARQAHTLRAHLETCAGCRAYWQEVSNVTQNLAASGIGSDLRASETFHRKVVARLRTHERRPVGGNVLAPLRALFSNSRMALPILGAAALIVAVLVIVRRPPPVPLPPPIASQAVLSPQQNNDLDPTISNYQRVAHRSLEKLDELLSRQANKNLSPIPIYTASALSRGDEVE